jgi:hypothetical protein
MRAAQENHINVAIYLIHNGASVTLANNDGMTPLMLAAQRGLPRMASLLIRRGAQICVGTKTRCNALMLAAKRAHLEVARVLVSFGADLHAEDFKGHSAFVFLEKSLKEPFRVAQLHDWLQASSQREIMRRCLRYRRYCLLTRLPKLVLSGSIDVASFRDSVVPPAPIALVPASQNQSALQPFRSHLRRELWAKYLIDSFEKLPLGVYTYILEFLPDPREWALRLSCPSTHE